MQDVIEGAVRWIGYGVLRLITLGWYRGGKPADRLPEGAFGIATLGLVMYLAYLFR